MSGMQASLFLASGHGVTVSPETEPRDLYVRVPELPECPSHAALFADQSGQDLVDYAYACGAIARQMDTDSARLGLEAERQQPIRGGFRFVGPAADAYALGYQAGGDR